jgi:hypothetical protein
MTEATPRRRLWTVLLSVALLSGFVAGLVTSLPGLVPLVAVPVVILCAFAAGFAMLKLRPSTTSLLAAPLAVFVVTGLTVMGSHSLWLTMFGERATGCEVISVNEHTHRRSPTSYSNDVMCGSRRISRLSSDDDQEVREPGDRVDLIIDKVGVVGVLEPSEVTWWRNLLVPTAAATGVAFVLVVLKRPKWKPSKPTARRNLDKDFL